MVFKYASVHTKNTLHKSCKIMNVHLHLGFFMASEVAYYTYIYAKVEKNKYNRVTGYTRASLLSGRFLAGMLAQILISFKLMNVRELNYISLGGE
jgi:solute carrier family 19 (thiamine transporter), member 2/3